MRLLRRATVLASTAVVLSPVLAAAVPPAASAVEASVEAPVDTAAAPVLQPWLAGQLAEVAPTKELRVAVRGTSLDAARSAARLAGLTVQQRWPLVDTVVAVGPAAAVATLPGRAGVLRVDGDRPMAYTLATSHQATRSDEAAAQRATGGFTGQGVSVAVIDSGIDGTHPMFTKDGASTVVANLKNVCGIEVVEGACFQQVPTNDTDTISGGGHGTHVAGIAAGVPVTTEDPEGLGLRGSGSGAKLVGLSVGAAIGLLDAAAAQNWVLEHQRRPCAPATEQDGPIDADCPPIRVTNHSYGPIASEGEDQQFDEGAVSVQIQRALVAKGVTAVWAAGNDGGDGSFAATNPDAMDPTPGVVMVASYDDGQTGNPDNQLSSFSSRGKAGAPGTYPDLAAPGDRITSACRPTLAVCQGAPSYDTGNYQTISGTSMASPYVAGVVAQLVGARPDTSPARVEQLLEDTAHRFTQGGAYESDPRNATTPTSFDKGHGLVDVLGALNVLIGKGDPRMPAPVVLAPRCEGTDLVTDPTGDTNAPGGTGAPAPAQDLTGLSFGSTASSLQVTASYADLSDVPAPGSTTTSHYVTWLGADGTLYGVRHNAPGSTFQVGEFDPAANRLVAGTTSTVPGTKKQGPGGSITWDVPLAAVGDPAIPVGKKGTPAVRDAYGLAVAGLGADGTGLTFVAPVDRAPDGGAVPAWSVC